MSEKKLALVKRDANDRLRATGSVEPDGWERLDLRSGKSDKDLFSDALSRIELKRGRPLIDKKTGEILALGEISATYINAVRILTEMPCWRYDSAGRDKTPHFRLDERAQRIVCARDWPVIGPRGAEELAYHKDAPWYWDREDALEMAYYLGRITGADFEPRIAVMAAEYCAFKSKFDPVRDYLEALEWDGTRRLDGMLATYFGAEDCVWSTTAGSKWMIAAIARTMVPGCQVDNALVFEGEQGGGKTAALRILGGRWHAEDCPKLGGDESKRYLLGKWIVELGEMDALYKSDANATKNYMSTKVDNVRKPYATDFVDVPRRCVFAGTTNENRYLSDQTGNRRFWPVRVAPEVYLASLERDRDQLWAEAMFRYAEGEQWWLADKAHREIQAEVVSTRTHESPWLERVAEVISSQTPTNPTGHWTMNEILNRLDIPSHDLNKMSYQIGTCLEILGFQRASRKRFGGKPLSFWIPRK
jgi:putative DNA primase/helicase